MLHRSDIRRAESGGIGRQKEAQTEEYERNQQRGQEEQEEWIGAYACQERRSDDHVKIAQNSCLQLGERFDTEEREG